MIIELRIERPQSDFKGGWFEMWTILSEFKDKNGYNRKHGTFSRDGLTELGIVPEECKLVNIEEVKL